jgi:GT2 family glycosyltransferase
MKKVSIIVTSFNELNDLKESLPALLTMNYPKSDYEIMIMDESTDQKAVDYLKSFGKKIRLFHFDDRKGAVACKKIAVKESKYPYFVLIGADCVLEKNWIKKVLAKFDENPKYGFVSTYAPTGGTCTAYLKKAVSQAGGFIDLFNEKGTGMRDDTDLAFRIYDQGYESYCGPVAFQKHEHHIKPGLLNVVKYAIRRVKLQRFDPLLYRQHPVRAVEFFNIKHGFWMPIGNDFRKATGQWQAGAEFNLSSPTGVVIIRGKTPIHKLFIIIGALGYVFLVKLSRLYGSIKYGKLLI